MRKLALLLVSTAGLIVIGSSAMAADPVQPAPATAAATAAAPTEDANKVICRSLAAPTGSRLGVRRECKTQTQWDDARLQTQKDVSGMQANRGIVGPGKQ